MSSWESSEEYSSSEEEFIPSDVEEEYVRPTRSRRRSSRFMDEDDDEVDDEEEDPNREVNLPLDVQRMIARGLDYESIKALCRANKRWSRVCKSDRFYQELLDKMQWGYFIPPDDLLNDDFFDIKKLMGLYRNKSQVHFNPRFDYVRAVHASLFPGDENTVTIEGVEHVFHYFAMMPKDARHVNYGKKYTDEEILSDLRQNRDARLRGNPAYAAANVITLPLRRKLLMLFSNGIVPTSLHWGGTNHFRAARGNAETNTAGGLLDVLETEKSDLPFAFIHASEMFNIASPKYERLHGKTVGALLGKILRPCTFEDVNLDYHVGFSLAMDATMKAGGQDSSTGERRQVYKELLREYDVERQIDQLISFLEENQDFNTQRWRETFAMSLRNDLTQMIKDHQNGEMGPFFSDGRFLSDQINGKETMKLPFPFSASLWPVWLEQKLIKLRHALRQFGE